MAPGQSLCAPGEIVPAARAAFHFILQRHGSAKFNHYGQKFRLNDGDTTLCSDGAPFSYLAEGAAEMLWVSVSANDLKVFLPSPDRFCGRCLRANEGITQLASELSHSLFSQLEHALPKEFHARLARVLLDNITTAFAVAFDELITSSAIVTNRYARIRLYIEEHLRDADLSPRQVAIGTNVSARYLRSIFSTGKETVSSYILRRRLEECAKEMVEPTLRHLPLTKISVGWGFANSKYFSRRFRERFGMSPRRYRQSFPQAGEVSGPLS